MATCQTTQWVSTSPFVKLTVTETASTATTSTLTYRLDYISGAAASTDYSKAYTVVIDDEIVAEGSFNINGLIGQKEICSGTTTITKSKAKKTIECYFEFHFNLTWSGVYAGQKDASTTISIGAITQYSIKYNANGGTGAPSTQSKWHGEAIKLSSTKPTRTGYAFQGWGTSAADTTVDYNSEASYTANNAITLYAIWRANTYTVTYNANGGTGAPANQTKTYGTNLKLSTSTPTRTGYTFKGWATSANGAVSYQPGGTYTANNAITLYAVWELSYVHPKIYNAQAEWKSGQDGTNLLSNSAGPFVSGTDSTYGHQSILPNTVYPNGYSTMFPTGKIYTLMFDWSVNWGSITPVTDVQVRIGYSEESGWDSFETSGICASMTIPNLETATSGSVSVPFTFTSTYGTESGMSIHPIYHSSKDALDGATWTISNVRLVEGDEGDGSDIISVVFDWETTNSDPTGNLAFYDAGGSEVHSVSLGQLSGKSGHFEHAITAAEANTINKDASYIAQITLSDGTGQSTTTITLTGSAYTMDFLAGGKGVAFGKSAETEGLADFGFTAKFTGGIQNIVMLKNNDLNEVTTPNTYVSKNQGASSYANCPITSGTFVLEVMSAGAEGQVFQRLTTTFKNGAHKVYVRHYYQSAWGDWVLVYGGDTGWLDLTLSSGISVGTEIGYLKGRIKDGVLYIKGDVRGVSVDWKTIAQLPSNLIVTGLAAANRFTGVYSASNVCSLNLQASGYLYATVSPTGSWDSTKNISINVAICL